MVGEKYSKKVEKLLKFLRGLRTPCPKPLPLNMTFHSNIAWTCYKSLFLFRAEKREREACTKSIIAINFATAPLKRKGIHGIRCILNESIFFSFVRAMQTWIIYVGSVASSWLTLKFSFRKSLLCNLMTLNLLWIHSLFTRFQFRNITESESTLTVIGLKRW